MNQPRSVKQLSYKGLKTKEIHGEVKQTMHEKNGKMIKIWKTPENNINQF